MVTPLSFSSRTTTTTKLRLIRRKRKSLTKSRFTIISTFFSQQSRQNVPGHNNNNKIDSKHAHVDTSSPHSAPWCTTTTTNTNTMIFYFHHSSSHFSFSCAIFLLLFCIILLTCFTHNKMVSRVRRLDLTL